ncbi:MAG: PAS domain S-box protein [Burkholderiaceae bacterium]
MPSSAPRDQPDFRAFYDGLPIAVALLDDNFRFADVNSAFQLGFDYAGDELLGRPLSHLLDDATRERLPLIQSRMRSGETHHQVIECRVRSRLGRTYEASVHLSVLHEGHRRSYRAMVQSLGEIRERERLLLSQAEMFRVTIEQSPLPMSIQDNAFRFVMVNKAYVEFTGYTEQDLIGRDAAEFLHPSEDRAAVRRQRELVHAQGLSDLPRFSMRREIVRRDGRRVPYRMELGRSRGLDGQPLWVAVIIDLSQQEQAEARQAALLESVSAGVAHVVDGLIAQINPALARLTGRQEHELVDHPASTLFADPMVWPRLEAEIGFSRSPGSEIKRYLDLRSSTPASTRRCEIALRQVDAERPDHGLLLTVNDIGELLERSDRLETSLTELETLIDTEPVGIAHLESGRIVRTNRTLRQLLRASDADLIGQRFVHFCQISGGSEDLLTNFDTAHQQDAVLRADLLPIQGQPIQSLLHVSLVSGSTHESVVVALDLSQQLAALDYASRMQVRFDSFSAMVDQAVIIVDVQSEHVRHANAACRPVLGVDAQSTLGLDSGVLWRRLVAVDRSRAERMLRAAVQGHAGELTVERQDQDTRRNVRLRFYANHDSAEVFILGEDITHYVLEERQRLSDAIAQRETMVREVQHRIKNNLQGVAGLLEQTAIDQPALLEPVRKLAAKIQTIAQVHGLQIRPGESVAANRLVKSVVASLQRTMNLPISLEEFDESAAESLPLGVPETEAIAIALLVNELVTNACKHRRDEQPIQISLREHEDQFVIRVVNTGSLPDGFDPLDAPSPSRGMGLIAALLPRQGSALRIHNDGRGHVVSELLMSPPLLTRIRAEADRSAL